MSRPIYSRSGLVTQSILAIVADAQSACLHGDRQAAGRMCNAIETLLDDEFADERRQAINDTRLPD